MGVYDRDYARMPAGGPSPLGGMRLWSINTWIIVLNVGVFVLDGALLRMARIYGVISVGGQPMAMGPIEFFGHFSYTTAIDHLQAWRFLSFQFLHADLGHLFFNMLSLYFFGPLIEWYLGRRRYLAFYLICGVAGPIMYLLMAFAGYLVTYASMPMVGASAGIFGVLLAASRIAPDTTVMLIFPPIPVRLKTLALILLGLAAVTVFTQGRNAGGEAAHLGGAVAGYLLIARPHLLGWALGRRARPRMRYRG